MIDSIYFTGLLYDTDKIGIFNSTVKSIICVKDREITKPFLPQELLERVADAIK